MQFVAILKGLVLESPKENRADPQSEVFTEAPSRSPKISQSAESSVLPPRAITDLFVFFLFCSF